MEFIRFVPKVQLEILYMVLPLMLARHVQLVLLVVVVQLLLQLVV